MSADQARFLEVPIGLMRVSSSESALPTSRLHEEWEHSFLPKALTQMRTSEKHGIDFEQLNVWTSTFYALIYSLGISQKCEFNQIDIIHDLVTESGSWTRQDCSYKSSLLTQSFGGGKVKMRRDPNLHFQNIAGQTVKMLTQDLVVIFDQMMDQSLLIWAESAGPYPQSKIEKLSTHLAARYDWSRKGCLELVAVRNVLTHSRGKWNDKSIGIVADFLDPIPRSGERLIVGFPMLFRFRKAIRTFLNETSR